MYKKQPNNNLWHWFALGLVILSLLLLAACTPPETADTAPTSIAQEPDSESLTATAVMAATLGPQLTAQPITRTAIPTQPIASPTPVASETPFVPTSAPSPTSLACPDLPPTADIPLHDTPLSVVYLNEGNLWLWRETTFTAEPLTTTGGVTNFRFLPEQAAVTFLQAGDLWLWQQDNPAIRLTESSDVVDYLISDDTAVIAFIRALDQYQQELWAINRDGSNLRQLVSMAEFTEIGAHPAAFLATDENLPNYGVYRATIPTRLQWQPGTHNLAFDTMPHIELHNPGGIGTPPTDNTLWLLDVDSGERRLVLPHGQAGGPYWGYVSFAPDGRTFAIVSDTSISLANSDGSNRRDNLVTYPYIGLGHGPFTPSVYWSADSQFLRSAIPNEAEVFGEDQLTFTVWQIPAADGVASPLGTFSGFSWNVTFSPDLSQAAFWRPITRTSNTRELHIASVDGAWDVIYATGHLIEFKGWAPDSRQFAYWYFDEQRLYRGHLCQEPMPLVEEPPLGWSAVQWIDANRFFLLGGQEGSHRLAIGRPALPATPVVEMDSPFYQWNR